VKQGRGRGGGKREEEKENNCERQKAVASLSIKRSREAIIEELMK
jgi:hypothetical protein